MNDNTRSTKQKTVHSASFEDKAEKHKKHELKQTVEVIQHQQIASDLNAIDAVLENFKLKIKNKDQLELAASELSSSKVKVKNSIHASITDNSDVELIVQRRSIGIAVEALLDGKVESKITTDFEHFCDDVRVFLSASNNIVILTSEVYEMDDLKMNFDDFRKCLGE